jgi:rhodanese-related sulfurtransferase
MKEVTVQDLRKMMDDKEDFQLVDVREEYEYDTGNLGGLNLPLGSVLEQTESIPRTIPVIIYCRSGMRSAAAIRELESRFGFNNLANLKGGILAWSKEIDPGIQVS